jgi:AraC family transcriptional regulator
VSRELARLDCGDFTVRTVAYAAGERMPRHAHEYSNITAVISGDLTEIVDVGEHRGQTSAVLIKPAGTEHETLAFGRRGTVTVTVQMMRPMAQWAWFQDPASARSSVALFLSLAGNRRDDVERAAQDFSAAATAAADLQMHRKPDWLADLLTILRERCDQPLSFETLAHEIGIHPVYMSRAFHRHTGTTMHEHVRALRTARARHLLASTDRAIGSIAADAGFADPSHLTRTFRQTIGMTPKQYRRAING